MACSVNFSNSAEINKSQVAFRLTVDLQIRALTNVVKGEAAADERAFACLFTLLEHDRRLRNIHILPQTGCLAKHAGAVLLQLLRRHDRVDSFIAPTILWHLLICVIASRAANTLRRREERQNAHNQK